MGSAAQDAMRIRPAVPGDAAEVASLLGELGYPCSGTEAADRIATLLGDESQVLLVADVGGVAHGLLALHFLYLLPLGSMTCRITALIIDPAFRGRGIGGELIREAERIARREGAVRIEVTAARSRSDAHEIYRGAGFEETGMRFVKRLGAA